jgi:CDP-paratose 2-epimerase
VYAVPAAILRLGVIAGPWQMGKLDQGFAALWVARHLAGGALGYVGFGGKGHQVRDVLHVDDAADLVLRASAKLSTLHGEVYCAGGGAEHSVSLAEMTSLCEEVTGRSLSMSSVTETRPGDIPWYVTDYAATTRALAWRPTKSVRDVVVEIADWLKKEPAILELLGR